MAGGLLALLDDVTLIARHTANSMDDVVTMAGQTSAKSAALVVDDTAVTPTYFSNTAAERELPMIWKITKGSLFNKLVIILPIALLLSAFAPGALTPILMVGGSYLAYEGAQKIIEAVRGHGDHEGAAEDEGAGAEDSMVKSAIATDLVLSSEIMIVSLSMVINLSFWLRVGVLILVAIFMTLLVYGVVALLIRLDDIGISMIRRGKSPKLGRVLVKAMPKILDVLDVVGTAAMLWVGGELVSKGLFETFWRWPYSLTEGAHPLVETLWAMVFGFGVGVVFYCLIELIKAALPNAKADGKHATNVVIGRMGSTRYEH